MKKRVFQLIMIAMLCVSIVPNNTVHATEDEEIIIINLSTATPKPTTTVTPKPKATAKPVVTTKPTATPEPTATDMAEEVLEDEDNNEEKPKKTISIFPIILAIFVIAFIVYCIRNKEDTYD